MGSAWDRTCELYAQLTGTRVDYGKAHAEKYGHARYGRTYEKPLFPGWGEPDADGWVPVHTAELEGFVKAEYLEIE